MLIGVDNVYICKQQNMVKILPAESYLALLDVTTYLCWYFI